MDLFEVLEKPTLNSIARAWLSLLRTYFRVDVRGVENIPKTGAVILAPNHSGFSGADAAILVHIVKRETRRRARILAHRAYFDFSEPLKDLAEKFGLRRASYEGGLDVLKKGNVLVLFPEGEAGNFKSTLQRYKLQRFHNGFLRMAIEESAPIVPVAIIGAEEANLNLGNINLSKWLKNIRIPLPVNFMPLPSKWQIVFLPPVTPDHWKREWLTKPKLMREEAKRIQGLLQAELDARIKERPYIYSKKLRSLLEATQSWVQKKVNPAKGPKTSRAKASESRSGGSKRVKGARRVSPGKPRPE